MATTVTLADVARRGSGVYPHAPIRIELCDNEGVPVTGYIDGEVGNVVEPYLGFAELDGSFSLPLVVNSEIQPDNTGYLITVGGNASLCVAVSNGTVEHMLAEGLPPLGPISVAGAVPTIGTVSTIPFGSPPTITVDPDDSSIWNFGIPEGADGADGPINLAYILEMQALDPGGALPFTSITSETSTTRVSNVLWLNGSVGVCTETFDATWGTRLSWTVTLVDNVTLISTYTSAVATIDALTGYVTAPGTVGSFSPALVASDLPELTTSSVLAAAAADATTKANAAKARATHTGTQLMATISDAGALATLSTVASAQITDGTIVNADINASAAIALSKLATDPLARANHTGTQTASTVSDFDTQVATTAALKKSGGKETVSTVSSSLGATPTLDLANGNVFDWLLSANITNITYSNVTNSVACGWTMLIRQPSSGGPYTITWPAAVKWSGGTAPTLSTVASRVDIISFVTVDGGTTIHGFLASTGSR